MSTQIALDRIERNARRALRRDGLDELVLGMSVALIALFLYDQRNGWGLVFGIGIQSWLKDLIRRHTTYPRIGYARLPAPPTGKQVLSAILGVLSMVVLGLLLMVRSLTWALPLYTAAILTGLALAGARKSHLWQDYAYAATTFLSGTVSMMLVSREHEGTDVAAAQLVALCGILLVAGSVRFISFMSKDPEHAHEE